MSIDYSFAIALLVLLSTIWPAVTIHERRAILRFYADNRPARAPGGAAADPPGAGPNDSDDDP